MRGLSANISLMYSHLPFLERLGAAAGDGFVCVEFWVSPDQDATARELATLGLEVAVINVDMGPQTDSAGRLSDPKQKAWWRNEFLDTLDFALRIGSPAINLLAGGRPELARTTQVDAMVENLSWALDRTPENVALLLEPLNRVDRPHYLLHTVDDARAVFAAVGEPRRLRLLFDVYHLSQEEPDVAKLYVRHAAEVGHVQVADVPGRGAPGTGAIDFTRFWGVLGGRYDGWLGLEYVASADALGWLMRTPHAALRPAAV